MYAVWVFIVLLAASDKIEAQSMNATFAPWTVMGPVSLTLRCAVFHWKCELYEAYYSVSFTCLAPGTNVIVSCRSVQMVPALLR